VFSTVPSDRSHLGRGLDGNTPSFLGQDGNGAVSLEENGHRWFGWPKKDFSPSQAVNYRHPRMNDPASATEVLAKQKQRDKSTTAIATIKRTPAINSERQIDPGAIFPAPARTQEEGAETNPHN